MQEVESCYFINSLYHSTMSFTLNKLQWSFLSVDYRISGFNFLKVKIGLFIDISLFLESSVNPKAPSLLTVPLPSLTSPHPAWGTEPCVSRWHRSSSPAPHSPALPAQGWGCTGMPQMPTSCWRWHGPWHQTLPWAPLCPDMALCVLPYKAFSINLYCLSFFLKYYVAWNAKHMIRNEILWQLS